MLDKYISSRTSETYNTTINQQPNDAADAARLYGEIRKEAEEDLINIASLRIKSLDSIADYFSISKHSPVDFNKRDSYSLMCVYKVNGKKYEHAEDFELKSNDPNDRFSEFSNKVIKAISEKIALDLLKSTKIEYLERALDERY